MISNLVPDPYAITMDRNLGASGGRRTLSVEDRKPSISRAIWKALHEYFAADPRPVSRVVLLSATPSEVSQLDWQRAGNPLRVAMSKGLNNIDPGCMVANLGDPVAISQLEKNVLSGTEPHLFVVGNVLEQIVDPRPLLRMLRRLLKCHADSRLVIATLDCSLDADGSSVRLWRNAEFASFLVSAGFDLLFSVQITDGEAPIAINEVRCSPAYYEAFLAKSFLPVSSTRLMLVSASYDDPHTSNIERYLSELKRSHSPLIVLSVNRKKSQALKRQWLRTEDFTPKENALVVPDSILEAVLHVIFIYDEVVFVEYQDYGGMFFRVSQAKRSGLLPPSLFCQVVCHGNRFFVERITKKFQSPSENLHHLWEKIVVELADSVLFPTRYMKWLYLDQLGLRPLGKTVIQSLPFTGESNDQHFVTTTAVSTIVFLGAHTTDGGWREFRAATRKLGSLSRKSLNPWDPELRRKLSELAPKSIVVVGQSLSSYPYPLMQAVDAGCTVLVASTGGVDELIPTSFHEQVLFDVRKGGLLIALRRSLGLSSSVRASQAAALRLSMSRQHEIALALSRQQHSALPSLSAASALNAGEPPVTVVVPVFNRPFYEIEDLIIGINRQTLPPFEVIFVDDASEQDFAREHAQRVSASLCVPARFIRHSVNKGLSAARNTGLQACKTEFVAMHDSDNVAANDFLYRGCLSLIENPQVEAVTFETMTFQDGTDWRMHDPFREYYRPLGDGLAESLGPINWLGDAMGVYRVEGLRQTGGWDETDRAMWEDLALFIKLAASGRRIMNIPRVEVFYRIRENSMLRTGSQYDARQRLVRTLRDLSLFDAFSIQRTILGRMSVHDLSLFGFFREIGRRYLIGRPQLLRYVRRVIAAARGMRAR